MKKSDKFILGTVIGGAIGSVLGLLFAPKPGKETRKDIADASRKAYKWGKKRAEDFHEDHRDEFDEAAAKLQDSATRIRRSFLALKKRTLNPAIRKLTKTRHSESKTE